MKNQNDYNIIWIKEANNQIIQKWEASLLLYGFKLANEIKTLKRIVVAHLQDKIGNEKRHCRKE